MITFTRKQFGESFSYYKMLICRCLWKKVFVEELVNVVIVMRRQQQVHPTREFTYLMYFDVNSLYGYTMKQCLPYGGFMWLENADWFEINLISDDSPIGFIFEVDLEYPEHLHNLHREIYLYVQNIKFYPVQSYLNWWLHYSKNKYVIRYRNLKQALSLGVILRKIDRILQFNQSPWLKPYVDLNIKLRKNSKNAFEKNLYKLMVNAVFGKWKMCVNAE